MVKTGAQRCVHVFGILSWVEYVETFEAEIFVFDVFCLESHQESQVDKSFVYVGWLFWMMPGRMLSHQPHIIMANQVVMGRQKASSKSSDKSPKHGELLRTSSEIILQC